MMDTNSNCVMSIYKDKNDNIQENINIDVKDKWLNIVID